MNRLAVAAALALSIVALAPSPLRAEPTGLTSGRVTLPLSGLDIELPKDKRKGHTWNLSASYALEANGFDGRDVIDEKIDGKLVSGTWILVGHFTKGDCKAVLASGELADSWTAESKLFGADFHVRGGVFDFAGELGKTVAVMLCTERAGLEAGERKSLLLYHFFIDRPTTTSQKDLLAALPKRPSLERATRSWLSDKVDHTPPLKHTYVRNRGDVLPNRKVTLQKADLSFDLPDDGYIWLPRAGAEDEAVDWFDRIAPALPELSVEVMLAEASCDLVFESISAPRFNKAPAARNLSPNWVVGPVLDIDGDPEYTLCRTFGERSVIVGVFLDRRFKKEQGDLTSLTGFLAAISKAFD
jgi:hypothetical protein